MREINFRAWHEGNKDFIYFDLQDLLVNGYHNAQIDILQNGDMNPEYKTKEELSKKESWFKMHCKPEQYTGRKDFSSFKEVYQGDKVNIITDGREIKDLIVEWSDEKCGFVFVNEDWNISFFKIEHIEITGNIHEIKKENMKTPTQEQPNNI